jgi:signal transduction histidine kinase
MNEMDFEVFSITDTVNDIINRFSRLREHDNYHIDFNSNQSALVSADQAKISQVIYNLLINAMTYTGPDKRVTVNQIVQNGKIHIQIIDYGEGISPESLDHVWDRYYRAEENHKRAVTGAGLGLSIVKSILDKHPGVEYGVESEMGHGSMFWFALPCYNEPSRDKA